MKIWPVIKQSFAFWHLHVIFQFQKPGNPAKEEAREWVGLSKLRGPGTLKCMLDKMLLDFGS